MAQLRNLDTEIINPFLISFLKYATEKYLSEEEIWRVLDLVEGYFARRIICSISASSLSQVFCTLHRDVLHSLNENDKAGNVPSTSYYELLAYHIIRRKGNSRIPRDKEFTEGIKTRNAYKMSKCYQYFLFERLENLNHTEFIDVKKHMQSGVATIEHIMPQTLTSEWRRELGDQADMIHEQYLHTLANLTLTGVNLELSNKSFKDKKNGKIVKGLFVNGYKGSIYRMTQELMEYNSWGPIDLYEYRRLPFSMGI